MTSGIYCKNPEKHDTFDDSHESGMVYYRHCYRELKKDRDKWKELYSDLQNVLSTHEPHGHNVTNQQYSELREKVKQLEEIKIDFLKLLQDCRPLMKYTMRVRLENLLRYHNLKEKK